MAHVSKNPYQGKVLVDATPMKAHLYDLAPGATRVLKREQDGIEDVRDELPGALGQHAKTIGIDPDVLTRIDATTNTIAALRALHAKAQKLAEVLGESVAYHEDEREADFSMIAEAVKRHAARKDPSVTAAFEKLLAYVGQVGVKAAATRRKNEAAQAESNAAELEDAT